MALPIHSSCFINKTYPLLHFNSKSKFFIRSQDPSSSAAAATSGSNTSDEPKKPTSPGLGFGPNSSPSTSNKPNSDTVSTSKKKKQKSGSGKRERTSVIRRRLPVEKPGFGLEQSEENQSKEQNRNESAFLLAWLGLGAVILVEGIVLAASGFLPEEWDKFFVKYLYPSFTPTVGLFIAGTVGYGVLKYLENEKLNGKK